MIIQKGHVIYATLILIKYEYMYKVSTQKKKIHNNALHVQKFMQFSILFQLTSQSTGKISLPISYTCITKDLLAFGKISKLRGQIISTGGIEI